MTSFAWIARVLAPAGIMVGLNGSAIARSSLHTAGASAPRTERAKMVRATGTFAVTLTPQGAGDPASGTPLGRMAIEKQFHGDLEATSLGTMLTAGTSVSGSAGYVAIERVTGTLHARRGTFILQHNGTMNRGAPSLTIHVVPDSGTDELAGLSGSMTIQIDAGKHSYVFEYTLPGTR